MIFVSDTGYRATSGGPSKNDAQLMPLMPLPAAAVEPNEHASTTGPCGPDSARGSGLAGLAGHAVLQPWVAGAGRLRRAHRLRFWAASIGALVQVSSPVCPLAKVHFI
jgi:hypothetical protein